MRLAAFVLALTCLTAQIAAAQPADLSTRVSGVEAEVAQLRTTRPVGQGIFVLFFGIFAALWAQNTGRNPWLWFFLGAIFNVIAGFVLLWKNTEDRKRQAAAGGGR
jgi:hypothetical protein